MLAQILVRSNRSGGPVRACAETGGLEAGAEPIRGVLRHRGGSGGLETGGSALFEHILIARRTYFVRGRGYNPVPQKEPPRGKISTGVVGGTPAVASALAEQWNTGSIERKSWDLVAFGVTAKFDILLS